MKKIVICFVLGALALSVSAQNFYEKRKGYIGLSVGPSVPIGTFGSRTEEGGLAKTGVQLNLVNFGYLFSEHVGIAGNWFGAANLFDIEGFDPWSYGGLMVGPLISFPAGETVEWDLRPMVGYSVVTEPLFGTQGSALALSLGTTFRFNVGEKVALLLGAEYFYTKPVFEDAGFEQNISTLSLTFGIAFRLK